MRNVLSRLSGIASGAFAPAAPIDPRNEAARTALTSVVSQHPAWNIRESALAGVAGHLNGSTPLSFWWDDDEDEDDCGPGETYELTADGVAIIQVFGTLLSSEPSWWTRYLGYTSLPALARCVTACAADARVKKILLQFKSPGGMVLGLKAACDAVWAVRQAGEKPIWATCTEACSAAYEIASQCEKVYLAPDGMGVCLGTILPMSDWSGYYSAMGVTWYRITSTGAETYKGAGMRGTKLTPEQRTDFQRTCDEYREIFDEIIGRGRGLTPEQVRSVADGRVFVGKNALAPKDGVTLFDGVFSPEEVLTAFGSGASLESSTDAIPPEENGDGDTQDDKQKKSGGMDASSTSPSIEDTDRPNRPSPTDQTPNTDLQDGNGSNGDVPTVPAAAAEPTAPTAPTGGQESLKKMPTIKQIFSGLAAQFARAAEEATEETAEGQGEQPQTQQSSTTTAPAAAVVTPPATAEQNRPATGEEDESPAALRARIASLEAERDSRNGNALTAARQEAERAAVTAFADNRPALESARAVINGATDVTILNSLTATYKAVSPINRGNGRPQTRGNGGPADEATRPAEGSREEQLAILKKYAGQNRTLDGIRARMESATSAK